ncbi:MAG: PKD domain-containing protein [Bacteroidota bacterium]
MLLLFTLAFAGRVTAQCPQLLDENGVAATNPSFLLCSKDARTLFLSFNRNFGNYTINWGDGTAVTNGTSYTTGNVVSHNYAAGVSNYTVTITIAGPPVCTLYATVVKEEPTTASIQVPFGGVTRACAPAPLQFVNSSTNNSSNTVYVWNFGDGTPNQTFNSTNLNQTITHMYQRGTVDCITKVTLAAYNFCNVRQGSVSVAEYSPILIWDLDKPAIGSDTLFCYPDTVVTFTNTTLLNCVRPGEGNVEPRTEYWRFINYLGPGKDSIIDWRPFGPPRTMRYPGIGTYTVELRERSFCGEVSTMKTIRIIDAPIAGITADKDTICIGESITYTNTSTGPANIFRWDPGNGAGWQQFPGTKQTLSYTQPGRYEVKLAINVNGGSQSCKDTAKVVVIVVPDPVANFTVAQRVGCDSLITAITNTSVDAVNFNWNFGNGTTSTQKDPVPQRYVGRGFYIILLATSSSHGCTNSRKDTVYVYNSPVVNFTTANLCAKTPVQLSNTTTGDPLDPVITWAWDFGDGKTSSQRDPVHSWDLPGTYVPSLTATSRFCSATKSVPLTVYPLPVAATGANVNSGCTPLNVQFGNTSTGAVSYRWDFGDGSPASTQNTPAHQFVNTGTTQRTFQVRLIAISNDGCMDTTFIPITVFPSAKADFSFVADNKCVSLDVTFTNISSGGIAYKWYFGDGDSSTAVNPVHSYVNSSSFVSDYRATLIVTSANGCIDSITRNISVNPEARFGFTASPDSGCSPMAVNFTAKTGAASYTWEFQDGEKPSGVFVQKTFVNNGTTELKFTVKLTATTANGCLDVTMKQVTVFPNPVAALQINPPQGCAPLTATLVNNSVGGQTYEWDYGDANIGFTAAPSHQYLFDNSSAAPLNYKVILKAVSAFGCADTASEIVRVFPRVNADFDKQLSGCGPLSKTFTAFGGATYFWNFGNGDIATTQSYTTTFTNISHTRDTIFPIKLIATSIYNCTDTVLGQATIYPSPLAAFAPDKLQGCSPLQVNLTNTSTGGVINNWNYGDGNGTQQNAAVHPYNFVNTSTSSRTYSIQLVTQSNQGCRDTTVRQVSVFPAVVANFVHDTIGCDPFRVKFFNTTVGASTYNWNLDIYGNSIQKEPEQIFNNTAQTARTYNVRLIVVSPDNCRDTADSRVHVYPKPLAGVNLLPDKGCQPLQVSLQNTTPGTGNTFQWSYGMGNNSTSADPVQTRIYPNVTDQPVNYNVSLVARNAFGCTDTMFKVVEVYPKVQALFDTILPGCSPLDVPVQNRSIGSSSITWNFNNEKPSFENSDRHTFMNTTASDQQKFVQLIAENTYGCKDTLERRFVVRATPDANFTATPELQRFPQATVNMSNQTLGSWNFEWNFGDNSSTSNANPGNKSYTTWGKYIIRLKAFSAFCEDTISKLVEILPPIPIARFDGGGEGCKPLTTAFSNQSQYADTYVWDFGDGSTSTNKDPVHTFYDAGTYSVTLRTTGFGGEQDVINKVAVVTVHDNAEAYFTYSPENAATNTDPIDFVNLSKRADYFHWDFGDGVTSTEDNPTHIYAVEGVFDVVLIADNFYNCPDTFLVQNAVKIVDGGNIELPTAFTPNPGGGSGGRYDANSITNDVFFPFNKDVEVYKMEVFSRWGEKIFESTDINIGWDGYFNGKLCQQDVYVYKISAIFKGGKKFEKVGDVTLLR